MKQLVLRLITFEYRRNVGCVVLMYMGIRGKCSTEVKQISQPIKSINKIIYLFQRSQPPVLQLPAHHTTRYPNLSLFKRITPLSKNPYPSHRTSRMFTNTTPFLQTSRPITLPVHLRVLV